ncbi:hypothetical protein MVES1_002884 [Malassezia vespertilionis]|uniref:Uncharacterized protein n=1 Tax=Malassezia vespertilionis TaxID=2020962 RepID=A0A2N1J9G5_9BASI|nr:uncharacterized protein MVES1_002884 [Malassezia vespertilionis]PKI83122.1 hypothetical protein MVES_002731 [Malassezia vespertilionis]WFD07518.1 hypothetical protein MVES1_002884 [Malassezia vespertilionis]
MVSFNALLSVVALGMAAAVSAAPNARRASPDNQVWVTNVKDHCLILPKHKESIGDSERPGGTRSFCTKPYDGSQGQLNSDFWTEVHFKKTSKYVQLTGCINPKVQSTLKLHDDGGQYDSNGGDGGKGNPRNSVCLGYAAYVELVEPSNRHACIRCCHNPKDCNVNNDEDGCEAVIPGKYC